MRAWTAASARMCRGRPRRRRQRRIPTLPPEDTGEALGLARVAAHAHVRLRARDFFDKLGLDEPAARVAAASCPRFPDDALDPGAVGRRHLRPGVRRRSAGRLPRGPQPGADRPRRWSSCAGRSSASAARRPRAATQSTPRNLMGFKDGTNNIEARGRGPPARAPLGRRRTTSPSGCAAARTSSRAASGC